MHVPEFASGVAADTAHSTFTYHASESTSNKAEALTSAPTETFVPATWPLPIELNGFAAPVNWMQNVQNSKMFVLSLCVFSDTFFTLDATGCRS